MLNSFLIWLPAAALSPVIVCTLHLHAVAFKVSSVNSLCEKNPKIVLFRVKSQSESRNCMVAEFAGISLNPKSITLRWLTASTKPYRFRDGNQRDNRVMYSTSIIGGMHIRSGKGLRERRG